MLSIQSGLTKKIKDIMEKEILSQQYAEKAVRESPNNLYKGYDLHRQMELTRFDGYDIQQAYEDGFDASGDTTAIVTIEGTWFWGISIHHIISNGKALVKLVFDRRSEGICEIYDLNTHPDCQKKGYASRLMKLAEETARQKGCFKTLLWVEKDSWQEAWYRRLGYVDEEFMQPVSKDTVWLEKFLKR